MKPYAVQHFESRGRKHDEKRNDSRDPFQLDRARIIHSRAWRRMEGKTQVFVATFGDHYRNRMTHSLEVASIARDLARALGLNEDLAECIGLAHDLGHTPFGHAGEDALNECMKEHGGRFEHNEQSLRVVTELEDIYPEHRGLNLSVEVLEGMMKHHTSWDHPAGDHNLVRPSLEAQVVNLADEIAYQNHDVDDGLRSGLFSEEDLMEVEIWREAAAMVEAEYGKIERDRIRQARTISKMVGLMIDQVIEESRRRFEAQELESLEQVYQLEKPLVGFAAEFAEKNRLLKQFLMKRLYLHPEVQEKMQEGQRVLQALFRHFLGQGQSLEEVRDYLAGMTDSFALEQFEELGLS